MRCKNCSKTFRSPPPRMRESQICTQCQDMLYKKEDVSNEHEVVKITTQFIDNCAKCNSIIYKKNVGYRNQLHELLCDMCGIKEVNKIERNRNR